jgi:hypothetical protein
MKAMRAGDKGALVTLGISALVIVSAGLPATEHTEHKGTFKEGCDFFMSFDPQGSSSSSPGAMMLCDGIRAQAKELGEDQAIKKCVGGVLATVMLTRPFLKKEEYPIDTAKSACSWIVSGPRN